MFNGQDNSGNADFVAFGIKFGYPELRFKLGGGVAKIQSDLPVQPGQWHTATLWRSVKNASMTIDDRPPVHGSAVGIFQVKYYLFFFQERAQNTIELEGIQNWRFQYIVR